VNEVTFRAPSRGLSLLRYRGFALVLDRNGGVVEIRPPDAAPLAESFATLQAAMAFCDRQPPGADQPRRIVSPGEQ